MDYYSLILSNNLSVWTMGLLEWEKRCFGENDRPGLLSTSLGGRRLNSMTKLIRSTISFHEKHLSLLIEHFVSHNP